MAADAPRHLLNLNLKQTFQTVGTRNRYCEHHAICIQSILQQVAELIATHLASKEIMWARSLLGEMGYLQINPTILQEDNMSTIHIINNDCNGQKTKHVDIRYNLVREQVQLNHIKMEHLSTKEMTADILTKALAPTPFLYLRKKLLGMYSTLYTPNIINLFLTN